tara:strand:+ start:540 stop:1238 length:699 start_codon:yes stop_codon:yes gene_type:complete
MLNNTLQTFDVNILTLFPEVFPGTLGVSLLGKALEKKIWQISTINIRDFAFNKQKSVDDTPYGGGAGMVMRPDVISLALESLSNINLPRICLSAKGSKLTQSRAIQLSKERGLILLCGRYEGIDQRVIDHNKFEEISIGDYVLPGGESAAIVLLESVVRLLPNVLGGENTLNEESFNNEMLLEYPHYTKPKEWKGMLVPEILVSGDHKKIQNWRNEKRLEITKKKRPDLLNR